MPTHFYEVLPGGGLREEIMYTAAEMEARFRLYREAQGEPGAPSFAVNDSLAQPLGAYVVRPVESPQDIETLKAAFREKHALCRCAFEGPGPHIPRLSCRSGEASGGQQSPLRETAAEGSRVLVIEEPLSAVYSTLTEQTSPPPTSPYQAVPSNGILRHPGGNEVVTDAIRHYECSGGCPHLGNIHKRTTGECEYPGCMCKEFIPRLPTSEEVPHAD